MIAPHAKMNVMFKKTQETVKDTSFEKEGPFGIILGA